MYRMYQYSPRVVCTQLLHVFYRLHVWCVQIFSMCLSSHVWYVLVFCMYGMYLSCPQALSRDPVFFMVVAQIF